MNLLGVRIDNVLMPEALDKIRKFLNDGKQHYIVTVNSEFIVTAQKDEAFREILNGADLAISDGIGPVWASKLTNEPLEGRLAGVDLIQELKKVNLKIKRRGVKIFLLGSRGGAAKSMALNWPQVTGTTENLYIAVSYINKCKPDVLLVALGAPKQEKWIAENLKKMPSVKVAIGVGGAFDMVSGQKKRAPEFMRKFGLEWLWRLILEPKRLPRIINAVVVFPWLVIKAKIFNVTFSAEKK